MHWQAIQGTQESLSQLLPGQSWLGTKESLGDKFLHLHPYLRPAGPREAQNSCLFSSFLSSPLGLEDPCVSLSMWHTHPSLSPTLLMRITLQGSTKHPSPAPGPGSWDLQLLWAVTLPAAPRWWLPENRDFCHSYLRWLCASVLTRLPFCYHQ